MSDKLPVAGRAGSSREGVEVQVEVQVGVGVGEGGFAGGSFVSRSETARTDVSSASAGLEEAAGDASYEGDDATEGDASTVYSNMLDWRLWQPGPWNRFARYESRVQLVRDKYLEKGYVKMHVPDLAKPKDVEQFVDVEPRLDARGRDKVAAEFVAGNTMRVHLPLGDFHEGDECEFYSIVDSCWFSDAVVKHEHPYTGTLAVEFDRSNPNGQHSKASRMAVISREDAADRLILNRAGRTSKTLESRSMIGQKKLRRRPLYMSNMAWRQRLAAMTPLNVVVGGNLHNLRAQAKHFGLMTVGLDAAGILDMIKEHVKKAQTSEVNKLLASRRAAAAAGRDEFGSSRPLRHSYAHRAKLREQAIKNKWLLHNRAQRDESEAVEPDPAEYKSFLLPAIDEHRRQQRQRLSQLPATVRAPLRREDAPKPTYLGRQVTNDGADVLEERAGYSAWKQHLYYKGQEAFEDQVHSTDDVQLQRVERVASPESWGYLEQASKGIDQAMIEEQKQLSLAAGAHAPTELQEWEAREYYLRKDFKRIEVKAKPIEQDPSKRLKESKAGQELQKQGKYVY